MALQIINAGPGPEPILEQIRERIAAAIPGATVEARCASPGHFEIRVISGAFEGRSRVQQHQQVYAAITELMTGAEAPVHAVDRLECLLP